MGAAKRVDKLPKEAAQADSETIYLGPLKIGRRGVLWGVITGKKLSNGWAVLSNKIKRGR